MDFEDGLNGWGGGRGGAEEGRRVSPLRGNLNHDEIVNQTKVVKNGLSALRDDHYGVLAKIREECEDERNANRAARSHAASPETSQDGVCGDVAGVGRRNGKSAADDSLLEERVNNVTRSLERLEVGIEESAVIIGLSEHFQRLEADRATLRLEMGRVQDENDWLREELGDTQKMLQEAAAELGELREQKRQWEFEEELKAAASETNLRPITPSKIPVGGWRVQEEKAINRALNGGGGGGESKSRAVSPGPSKIPMGSWRSKLSVYKKVMDKREEEDSSKKQSKLPRKYFNLNASSNLSRSRSKIPSR